MQHLEDGLLHELIDGEVPSEHLGPVQRHLAECASCRARLEAARDLAALTDGLIEGLDAPEATEEAATPVVPLPVRRSASQWSRGVGLAASLAVAVGVGWAARDLIPPPADDRAVVPIVAPVEAGRAPTEGALATDQPAREASPPASIPTPPAPTAAKATTAPAAAIATGDRAEARQPDLADAGIAPRVEVAPPVASAMARTSTAESGAVRAQLRTREQLGVEGVRMVPRENSLIPRDADQSSAKAAASPVVIEFAEAVALLGGRLRLIEGLVPSRLERVGDEVRVIYPIPTGNLVLSQQRVGEELRWRLIAPGGYPADSLDALRRRVAP